MPGRHCNEDRVPPPGCAAMAPVKTLLLRLTIAIVGSGALYAVYLRVSGTEVQRLILVNIVAIPVLLLILALIRGDR